MARRVTIVAYLCRYRVWNDAPDADAHTLTVHATRRVSYEYMQARLSERVSGAALVDFTEVERAPETRQPRAGNADAGLFVDWRDGLGRRTS